MTSSERSVKAVSKRDGAAGSARLSPTEARNPRSMNLDQLPIEAGIELMLSEEALVPEKLLRAKREMAQAIALVEKAFRSGGRLFYVGSGTSGRLGVLDASECPPTFGTDSGMVQAIIAGGEQAVWRAVEGAEDDALAGAREVVERKIRSQDVVVGIAASGTTPFVWGALKKARQLGAQTVLLCFNPYLRIPRGSRPSVVIAVDVGPEVLTGSTRLKCGTATKLVLNMLTTLAMVRTGKVVSNLMVDLKPANAKLRKRAVRLVAELTHAAEQRSRAALKAENWVVRDALKRLQASKR